MSMAEIVPSESAILHEYPAIGIHADHRNIARFASADGPGFVSLLGELRRWIGQVVEVDDEQGKGLCEIEKECSSGVALGDGWQEGYGEIGGAITIWGNVTESVIANGKQIIQGNLVFGGS